MSSYRLFLLVCLYLAKLRLFKRRLSFGCGLSLGGSYFGNDLYVILNQKSQLLKYDLGSSFRTYLITNTYILHRRIPVLILSTTKINYKNLLKLLLKMDPPTLARGASSLHSESQRRSLRKQTKTQDQIFTYLTNKKYCRWQQMRKISRI